MDCVQEVADSLRQVMESSPNLLLPVLDAVSGLSLTPHSLDTINTHVRRKCGHGLGCLRVLSHVAVVALLPVEQSCYPR